MRKISLEDVEANTEVGWFVDPDGVTVRQVMTLSPYTTRIVGVLASSESPKSDPHPKTKSNDDLKDIVGRVYREESGKPYATQTGMSNIYYVDCGHELIRDLQAYIDSKCEEAFASGFREAGGEIYELKVTNAPKQQENK